MKASRKLTTALAAALAVAALLAVEVSPAAAATKLCSKEEDPCAAGNQYKNTKALQGSATNTKFIIEPIINMIKVKVEVLCTGSTFQGKTTADSGVPISIETMFFAGCTAMGNGCTVISFGTPWAGSIAVGLVPNGTLQQVVSFIIQCPVVPLKCRYGGQPQLTVDGDESAQFIANGVMLNKQFLEGGEINCPSSAKWWVNYDLTPAAIFVTQ